MYTRFEINNSGNLAIYLTDEGKEWLLENESSKQTDESIFIDLIEDKLCNGYHLINPAQIGALTSSLLIADSVLDKETTPEEAQNTNIWFYNYYAIRSYLDDLKTQGYVIWTKAI